MERLFYTLLTLAVLGGLTGCTAAPAETVSPVIVERTVEVEVTSAVQPPDVVRMRLNWTPSGYQAWVPYAKELGYYMEENIVLDIREGNGSSNVGRVIANKSDDVGMVTPNPILVQQSEGAPITIVMTAEGSTVDGIVCRNDRGIETPNDLIGKTVLSSQGSGINVLWPIFVQQAKIDEKKVNWTFVDPSAQVPTVLAGKADCLSMGAYGVSELAAQGYKDPVFFKFEDYGMATPSGAIIVHDDLVATNPDLVRRFVRASQRGLQACIKEPEKCVDAMLVYFPQEKREVLLADLVVTIPIFTSSPGNTDKCVGRFVEEDWNTLLQQLTDSGSIKTSDPVTDYYTTEFVQCPPPAP